MSDAAAPEQIFTIQRIYLKDASLETPLGIAVFSGKWAPKIQLDVNTRTEKVGEDLHEVVLTLTATALQENKTALLVEVQQAGIFLCKGISVENLRHVVSTVCPDILFPYAREAIDALVIKASFPPLMLAPMNFDALYKQALLQQEAQKASATPAH
jgi:preprotein translocase subunit SecB